MLTFPRHGARSQKKASGMKQRDDAHSKEEI